MISVLESPGNYIWWSWKVLENPKVFRIHISTTVQDRGVISKDHARETIYNKSSGHVTQLASFLPVWRYASVGLHDSDMSICLYGRPSVRHMPILCLAERKQDREMYSIPSDSTMTLVSGKVWVVEKFARGHPKRMCQMRVGWVFSAIFDQYVVISRKRCILDTMLLWDGNRKPYASYRMVSVSMTLSDSWPGFQGHGSFKRRISRKPCILHTKLL